MVQTIIEVMDKNLVKLKDEINGYHDEQKLWHKERSISNPAGNLCLHLVGNLNTYIGVALGDSSYVRNRDLEFSQRGISRSELLKMIDDTRNVVSTTLLRLTPAKLDEKFPMKVFETETTIGYMLVHLTGHLTYHLGQINYHRRLLDAQ